MVDGVSATEVSQDLFIAVFGNDMVAKLSMEKAFNKSPIHARLIRQIWKAGCERAVQFVIEARRLDGGKHQTRTAEVTLTLFAPFLSSVIRCFVSSIHVLWQLCQAHRRLPQKSVRM